MALIQQKQDNKKKQKTASRLSKAKAKSGAAKPGKAKSHQDKVRGAKEEPRLSLAEQAYDALKRKIFTLEFEPGAYLNEARVSEELGIGRNPVHNAVKRLVFEGLIDIMPRKGLIVRPLNLTEILEIAETRLVNETYCARRAAVRASEKDLMTMREILKRTENALKIRDVEAQMFLDSDFHCAIFKAARNTVMEEMMRVLHERSLRNWFVSLKEPEQAQKVFEEHSAIFKAIESHDPDQAEETMRFHIESSRENLKRQV